MDKDDGAYGISSATPTPNGLEGTVILFFSNGTKLQFDKCKDIEETELDGVKKIVFTIDKQRYVFKKDQLAGWSLPMTV